jgi:hypothetical protein
MRGLLTMKSKRNRITDHMEYLNAVRERIRTLILEVLGEGHEHPTVLVLDLRDRSARRIAEASGEAAVIADHHSRARECGGSPVVNWCVSRSHAAALLADEFSDVSAKVAAPFFPGGYAVVVVANGSATLFEEPPIEMLDGTGELVVEIKT